MPREIYIKTDNDLNTVFGVEECTGATPAFIAKQDTKLSLSVGFCAENAAVDKGEALSARLFLSRTDRFVPVAGVESPKVARILNLNVTHNGTSGSGRRYLMDTILSSPLLSLDMEGAASVSYDAEIEWIEEGSSEKRKTVNGLTVTIQSAVGKPEDSAPATAAPPYNTVYLETLNPAPLQAAGYTVFDSLQSCLDAVWSQTAHTTVYVGVGDFGDASLTVNSNSPSPNFGTVMFEGKHKAISTLGDIALNFAYDAVSNGTNPNYYLSFRRCTFGNVTADKAAEVTIDFDQADGGDVTHIALPGTAFSVVLGANGANASPALLKLTGFGTIGSVTVTGGDGAVPVEDPGDPGVPLNGGDNSYVNVQWSPFVLSSGVVTVTTGTPGTAINGGGDGVDTPISFTREQLIIGGLGAADGEQLTWSDADGAWIPGAA